MSKNQLIGVNNAAEKLSEIMVGVNNAAAKVIRVLVGDDNGLAQLAYEVSSGTLVSIPTMTSDSHAGASASSIQSNDFPAWKAFDKSSSSYWASLLWGTDHDRWVSYDFGYLVLPTSVSVHNWCSNPNNANQRAYSFVIEASVLGSTWDTLVDCSSNIAQVNTTYQISTSTLYRYYRYRCTNGSGTYRAGVYEFDVAGIKYE